MNKSESKYFNTAAKMNRALISLLKEKSFDFITVSEICKTAGVNRSTFYLHYENVGDLLQETTGYLIDGFLSYFKTEENLNFTISDCTREELNFMSDKYLTPYLTYIKENKEVFSTAILNFKTLGFEKTYERLFEHIFNPILKVFNFPEEYRNYVMLYYLKGITAIIEEWMKDECKKPISDISAIIQSCTTGLYSA